MPPVEPKRSLAHRLCHLPQREGRRYQHRPQRLRFSVERREQGERPDEETESASCTRSKKHSKQADTRWIQALQQHEDQPFSDINVGAISSRSKASLALTRIGRRRHDRPPFASSLSSLVRTYIEVSADRDGGIICRFGAERIPEFFVSHGELVWVSTRGSKLCGGP